VSNAARLLASHDIDNAALTLYVCILFSMLHPHACVICSDIRSWSADCCQVNKPWCSHFLCAVSQQQLTTVPLMQHFQRTLYSASSYLDASKYHHSQSNTVPSSLVVQCGVFVHNASVLTALHPLNLCMHADGRQLNMNVGRERFKLLRITQEKPYMVSQYSTQWLLFLWLTINRSAHK
jgi:hypothetical protein